MVMVLAAAPVPILILFASASLPIPITPPEELISRIPSASNSKVSSELIVIAPSPVEASVIPAVPSFKDMLSEFYFFLINAFDDSGPFCRACETSFSGRKCTFTVTGCIP